MTTSPSVVELPDVQNGQTGRVRRASPRVRSMEILRDDAADKAAAKLASSDAALRQLLDDNIVAHSATRMKLVETADALEEAHEALDALKAQHEQLLLDYQIQESNLELLKEVNSKRGGFPIPFESTKLGPFSIGLITLGIIGLSFIL